VIASCVSLNQQDVDEPIDPYYRFDRECLSSHSTVEREPMHGEGLCNFKMSLKARSLQVEHHGCTYATVSYESA